MGPAELVNRIPQGLVNGSAYRFHLRYNEADPSTVRLRFQVQRATGGKHDYFVELTLSGKDLANATTVFKRIAEDSQGRLSVAEIPGTTVKHTTDKPIVVGIPKSLSKA